MAVFLIAPKRMQGGKGMDASISIRRRWLALVASLGISPMIALAASDDGTITVGFAGSCSSGPPGFEEWGYLSGGQGSYSPTGLTGGKTVVGLYALLIGVTCIGTVNGHFAVSGFSSDPGQSWLTSVACNGTTKTGATATYSYSSGTAQWTWSATSWGFNSKVGSQLACTIEHG
jgi:hypothetical protein